MSRQQYSPNPSPMVPEPPPLEGSAPPVRPPPIPSFPSSQSAPPTPGWAQPQHQSMGAFPQGYPTTATPYTQYVPMGGLGSYYHPPVVLPQNVPPTPEVQVGANGFSADWHGSAPGIQQTPFNGPQPHTGFNAFQQPLPGGPPPGFTPWAAPIGASTPASWHQPVPPATWGQPPPPPAGAWGQPPAPGWAGPPPSAGAHPAWGGGGGGGGPWQQQPAVIPQAPPPVAPPAYRDRSNEGLDRADKFAVGSHYGPVLTPLLLKIVNAPLTINPLLCPPDASLENNYLKWNMLFTASHCVRSDDPPQRSWSRGRLEPATHPRLTELRITSRAFPWTLVVYAQDDKAGVTCGEIIDRLDDFLHKNIKKEDADLDTPEHAIERNFAYHHNRSTAIGVPGGRLGDGLKRLDWLCKDTIFGGLVSDEAHCLEAFSAVVPGVVTLLCTTRYPLTEQEMREQDARETEAENLRERVRVLEERDAENEAKERERLSRQRSRSRSSRSGRSVRSARSARDEEEEDDDDDDESD